MEKTIRLSKLHQELKMQEQWGIQLCPMSYYVVRLQVFEGEGGSNTLADVPKEVKIRVLEQLMTSGYGIIYGLVEADELSVLFCHNARIDRTSTEKLSSVLAGRVSAGFSMELGQLKIFHAHVMQLSDAGRVCEYFLWRKEEATDGGMGILYRGYTEQRSKDNAYLKRKLEVECNLPENDLYEKWFSDMMQEENDNTRQVAEVFYRMHKEDNLYSRIENIFIDDSQVCKLREI